MWPLPPTAAAKGGTLLSHVFSFLDFVLVALRGGVLFKAIWEALGFEPKSFSFLQNPELGAKTPTSVPVVFHLCPGRFLPLSRMTHEIP